jgi:hypothetical protein
MADEVKLSRWRAFIAYLLYGYSFVLLPLYILVMPWIMGESDVGDRIGVLVLICATIFLAGMCVWHASIYCAAESERRQLIDNWEGLRNERTIVRVLLVYDIVGATALFLLIWDREGLGDGEEIGGLVYQAANALSLIPFLLHLLWIALRLIWRYCIEPSCTKIHRDLMATRPFVAIFGSSETTRLKAAEVHTDGDGGKAAGRYEIGGDEEEVDADAEVPTIPTETETGKPENGIHLQGRFEIADKEIEMDPPEEEEKL